MKHLIVLLALLTTTLTNGQFIDNQRFGLFDAHHPFSKSYISKNKVELAQCTRVMKPEGEPIQDKGLMTSWEFDKNGNLKQKMESFVLGVGFKDTLVVFREYDLNANCTLELVSDGDGYYAHRYEHDANGAVTAMTYTRETSVSGTKERFELGKRYDILGETYAYQYDGDVLLSATTFNKQGRPYLKSTYEYDSLGYLVTISSRYIITRKSQSVTYTYDDHGRIGTETSTSDFGGDRPKKWAYFYDTVGNMTEAKFYSGEVLKTTRQFMYDKKSLLVDAELIKDEASGTIEIRQYSYRFWNENQ